MKRFAALLCAGLVLAATPALAAEDERPGPSRGRATRQRWRDN